MILHFAVGCLPNFIHVNANLAQSIKHTVQHYDQKTVKLVFWLSIGKTGTCYNIITIVLSTENNKGANQTALNTGRCQPLLFACKNVRFSRGCERRVLVSKTGIYMYFMRRI